jgi:diguanylate cyclase (GGDEF)-like protein
MGRQSEQTMGKRKKGLIIIVSVLLVSGFLVTSLASYYVSRYELRSHLIEDELPLTSDNIYSEIQRDLMRPVFISSLMANDTFLRDWIISGEKNPENIKKYLKEIKEKYRIFASFFVSDKTRRYYHGGGVLKKVNPAEPRDNWYFRLKKIEKDYEINVDLDMANRDAMTIFINYKVFDYRRRYIGATGVGLTVSAVKKLIESYQNRYGRNVFFIDREGKIILYGPAFHGKEKNIKRMKGISDISGKILSTGNTILKYRINGSAIHVNSRFIPELNWYLIVEQREASITKNILKALFTNLLICSIITLVVLFLTNVTIKRYQNSIEKMAGTDKLTGALNRLAFDIILEQTIKDVERNRFVFSIIIFDLDIFKNINDMYGHLAGDTVLRDIANITRKTLRGSDVFSRWGGEEFLVILKDCGIDEAYGMAEKIRTAVREHESVYEDRKMKVTISIGVTEYRAGDNEDSLLSRADVALYRAKENGRDRTEKF